MDGLIWADDLPAPVAGLVFEFRVLAGDECELLCAGPTFQLSLSRDGFFDSFEGFDVEETVATVFVGEAGAFAGAVLDGAVVDAAGYANVEGTGVAAEDVDVAALFHAGDHTAGSRLERDQRL